MVGAALPLVPGCGFGAAALGGLAGAGDFASTFAAGLAGLLALTGLAGFGAGRALALATALIEAFTAVLAGVDRVDFGASFAADFAAVDFAGAGFAAVGLVADFGAAFPAAAFAAGRAVARIAALTTGGGLAALTAGLAVATAFAEGLAVAFLFLPLFDWALVFITPPASSGSGHLRPRPYVAEISAAWVQAASGQAGRPPPVPCCMTDREITPPEQPWPNPFNNLIQMGAAGHPRPRTGHAAPRRPARGRIPWRFSALSGGQRLGRGLGR